MKATTVREVKRVIEDVARSEKISLDEAKDKVFEQYEMICFMGAWGCDDTEVLVPDTFPGAAFRCPGVVIY